MRDANLGTVPFITPSQLRCIVDGAGKEKLVTLFNAMGGPLDDLSTIVTEINPTLERCGVDTSGFDWIADAATERPVFADVQTNDGAGTCVHAAQPAPFDAPPGRP